MSFHLKPGYESRAGAPAYYLDEDAGLTWQPDVYTLAETIADLTGYGTIVDLGCGHGDKLADIHNRHPDWGFVGYDYGANLEHVSRSHPWGRWRGANLEHFQRLPPHAVIICADVIEHLTNPTALIATLAQSRARAIILSTPERDATYGVDHLGPPPNEAHVREWNAAELCALLDEGGLHVHFAALTRGHNRQTLHQAATVVIIATPKET